MVVFVTSLRHPLNATDFGQVERLLDMSLRSICNQDDDRFRVVVVSNTRPRIDIDDPRIVYHLVDYPAPSADRHARIPRDAALRDKGSKLFAGILLARRFEPDYFAVVDADDLVSSRLAGFVNSRCGTDGWYVNAGYALDYRTRRIQRKYGLVRYCGSTLIPNAGALLRLSGVNAEVAEHSTPDEFVARAGAYFIDHVIGDHPRVVKYLAGHGVHLRPIPFAASVWVQHTGENHSGIAEGARTGIPINATFAREFGLSLDLLGPRAGMTDRLVETANAWQSWVGWLQYRYRGFPDPPV